MRNQSMKCLMIAGVMALLAVLAAPGISQADYVAKGYDLFMTLAGTTFDGVAFKGVPLGTFDFGKGPVGTGLTDTIVQRLDNVNSPSGTTDLLMRALQLETTNPTALPGIDPTVQNYFVTLNPDVASRGLMTINFAPQTFDSTLDVNFEIHAGSLNGPVVFAGETTLQSSGTAWQHPHPSPQDVLIPGVNYLLNGKNENNDFWPLGVLHTGPHPVVPATVSPEPSSLTLLGLGAFGAGVVGFWRRRQRPRAA